MEVCFLVLEPHFAVNLALKASPNQFWIFDPSALLRACPESIEGTGFGFWIPTKSPLKSKKSVRDAPL
jgi:hypothetical protein